jgi:hypothetical protein
MKQSTITKTTIMRMIKQHIYQMATIWMDTMNTREYKIIIKNS